mmetsp:Transcript_22936/g.64410  ORF Transcript_22936/g.64410 Transcript_22936/m.64410 type:complete len:204 (+) Transcript_22936:108-719(+)
MATVARRRLIRDLKKLQTDPPQGISASPVKDDIMSWTAVMFGPDDTPWEGGTFQLEVRFTEEFPTKAPHVKFISKMFHPNIYNNGEICLDILQNQWSPIYDISAILTSIQSLLTDPNPNSPANNEAAKLWSENRREYNRRVTQIVEESWEAADELCAAQEAAAGTEDGDVDTFAAGGGDAAEGSGATGAGAGSSGGDEAAATS